MDVVCQYCGAKDWNVGPIPTASSKEGWGCLGSFGAFIGFGVAVVVALAALWGLIALVKWFWIHS
jgi:hypothetical protein